MNWALTGFCLARPEYACPLYSWGRWLLGEQQVMGSASKQESFKLLDAYVEAGGNFIDTANNYQDEQSESLLGEWMKERQNRDLLVIATKYTLPYRAHELGPGIALNYSGNHRRSLHMSVRDSLEKLQTGWIDILYVHVWDWSTSVAEIMDSLHILVQQGKVLYLGVSDTPAWLVAVANEYAISHGKTPFSIYQGRWSIMNRDFERDIIPMARHYGMALAPWGVLGGGRLQTKKSMEERKKLGEGLRRHYSAEQTEQEVLVSEALETVAKEHGEDVSITAIALVYVLHKASNVFPIMGGRKVEHLEDNLRALEIQLTHGQLERLEKLVPFDIGFPASLTGEDSNATGETSSFIGYAGPISWFSGPKPLARN
ncbi:hypothetical protein FDECE_3451 [Fusarium decemcellulare]|nr:hypothetical protein FDECE_3451 [Fusarium decemcellulare]